MMILLNMFNTLVLDAHIKKLKYDNHIKNSTSFVQSLLNLDLTIYFISIKADTYGYIKRGFETFSGGLLPIFYLQIYIRILNIN